MAAAGVENRVVVAMDDLTLAQAAKFKTRAVTVSIGSPEETAAFHSGPQHNHAVSGAPTAVACVM